MREVVISRHGGPDVLTVRERPDPAPGPGQVRIRVRACGVNFADLLARLGLYPGSPKPPFTPGFEVAGVLDACGEDVVGLETGARVVAITPFGGYADTVVAGVGQVFRTPDTLSDTEAAAAPVNYLTAVVALYRLANLQAGETVLIHGAAGGVGIAAIQLARLRRAHIIGTASLKKLEALRAFGVDHPVDGSTDVDLVVRRLTGGRGVDVILDPLGGKSFKKSYALLAPLGRLILYGVSRVAPGERRRWWNALVELWQMPRFSPVSLIYRNRAVMGLHLGRLWSEQAQLGSAMRLLLEEFAADRLRPVVARTFPLEMAADAHRFIHDRHNIGKVVLIP